MPPLPSFEDVWREHKRFLVSVAGGLVVFFVGLSWAWSIDAQVRKTEQQNREIEAEIGSAGEKLTGREGYEAGAGITLERDLAPEVRTAVEFQPRPAFALKEGDSPFIVYGQAIAQVEATGKDALRQNISCPDDFGFVKEPPEERVRVYIAGADLVERVLAALVGVRVKAIESLKPGEADYVPVVDEPFDGAQGRPATGEGQAPPAAESPVLRRLPVHFAATGSLDALEM